MQADQMGNLQLPSTLLPASAPMALYEAQQEGDNVLIIKRQTKVVETDAEKAERRRIRTEKFKAWAKDAATPAGLSDYAVSRDSIYD